MAMKFLRVGGQSCICANRIFVQAAIADTFVPRFVDAARALRVGPGTQPGVVVGPLINDETRRKVDELVRDAVAAGARVAAGGHALDSGPFARGHFYAPTVLLGARDDMRVCQEEIFGPVAPVLTFRTEAELVERANATRCRSGASRSRGSGARAAARGSRSTWRRSRSWSACPRPGKERQSAGRSASRSASRSERR
jgi:succinate-semialdehyde dehydrogenase / glutarate-semialdehyde dehydrogenase